MARIRTITIKESIAEHADRLRKMEQDVHRLLEELMMEARNQGRLMQMQSDHERDKEALDRQAEKP